jgi:hypothetical protein
MNDNFIYTFNLANLSICDELINLFNQSNKSIGTTSNIQGSSFIDTNVKESIELGINPKKSNVLVNQYLKELQSGLQQYYQKYTNLPKVSLEENFNIQYYPKGGGYKQWHSERSAYFSKRYLVFMTYLNTVPTAGTEWLYQNYKTEAVKGLSVLWPSDFTHTHRGIITNEYEKYIVTGWLNIV